jgi:hypothetical protein
MCLARYVGPTGVLLRLFCAFDSAGWPSFQALEGTGLRAELADDGVQEIGAPVEAGDPDALVVAVDRSANRMPLVCSILSGEKPYQRAPVRVKYLASVKSGIM